MDLPVQFHLSLHSATDWSGWNGTCRGRDSIWIKHCFLKECQYTSYPLLFSIF